VAKLEVMCARALQEPVNHLLAAFTRDAGIEVDIAYNTVGGLQERIANGETADVLVLNAPMIERMEEAGALVPGSRAALGRTAVGLAVREGAPAPDISTPEAFKAALLAARSVAFSDPAVGGSAAVHLPNVFERLGITDAIKQKGMPQKSGGEVARRLAEGAAEVGMTMIAEMVPIKGTRVVGPLPAPFGHEVTYTAAVPAASANRSAALAFIRALTAPAARSVWQQAGFE
jgi:molybdate transport system substrate-binding protein